MLPAPAFALAAVPAIATIGLIGVLMLAASANRVLPARALVDPFELWRDQSGGVREMKLVGLWNYLDGSRAEFLTRDGQRVLQPIANLQRPDQERAWDAAFALKPVLSFKDTKTIAYDPPNTPNPRYKIEYNFEVSVLPIERVEKGSLRINRVPIEGLHGMTLSPNAWDTRVSSGPPYYSSVVPGTGRLQLVASGLFWAPSIRGALAEGSLRAVCVGDLAEQVVSMAVPRRGGSSSATVGPVRVALKSDAFSGALELEVKDDPGGVLKYAGFLSEGRKANVRSADGRSGEAEVRVSVGYYRRVKVVEVPFSGTAQ